MRRITCREVEKILGQSRLRELSEEMRQAIAAHAKTCPKCRRELAFARLVDRVSSKAPVEPAPESFAEAVMRRISQQELARANRFAWLRGWRPVVAVAAVALVLILAITLLPIRHVAVQVPAHPTVTASQQADASFVQELVEFHEQFAARTMGMDAGVLLASESF